MRNFAIATIALAAGLAAGTASAQDYNFRFQSSDPAGNPNFLFQQGWTETLKEMSGGNVVVEMLPVGTIVDYRETQEAVGAGLIDGHITDTSYFAGKDPAFGLIANPVGAYSDPAQMIGFVEEGGGAELMNELLNPYGLEFLGVSTPGLEAFVSKVPLDGVADLEGLKVRSPEGPIANVFAAAGASPVNLPASEVYTSLDKGVIDSADYSVFSVNQEVGLNEIAPHPVYPGFHSLPLVEVSMNKATWDGLPADVQQMFRDSIKEFQQTQIDSLKARDEEAVAAAEAGGEITVHDWSEEERTKFRAIAQEEWARLAGQSEMAQKVYDSLTAYLESEGLLQ